MSDNVRVRFAPSPTGYLHVGGARSALFNFLFARRHNGTFILRIEDTDRNRFVEGALAEIYDSLRWLGIPWDEGPGAEGECGPYLQSERLEIYKKHADTLIKSGHAYCCFCTPERIAALRTEQEKAKQPAAGYDRKCRALSKEEVEKNLESGMPYVIRLKIPAGRKVVFNDMIRGEIEHSSDVLDDLVLIKTDGFPTYHMANVVDDHLMRITHVLRGDEWITSTPRHVLLYEAFNWTPPHFAHLPIILAADGGKLSKRKGAASVMDYKLEGYLPEALLNFLSLLGWSPGDGDKREKMTAVEIAEVFSLDHVSPKSAVFDEKKLEWMNGLYMAERDARSLLSEILPVWKEKGWVIQSADASDPHLVSIVDMMKVRSKKITELIDNTGYFFADPARYEEKAAKKHFVKETADLLSVLSEKMNLLQGFDHQMIEDLYKAYSGQTGLSLGQLVHPTRLAVSGVSFGPGLFELMAVLGKETVLRRIKKAISHINEVRV
ncbi:MAG: glutamate--tRNA ligase [Chitinispirillaceae bacterium]|nr:glutamate--tRNA ligase [Chitinispirillaceae bacterium]